jgi:hypothetical protein
VFPTREHILKAVVGHYSKTKAAFIEFGTRIWCYTSEFASKHSGGVLEILITKPNLPDVSASLYPVSSWQMFGAPLGQIAVHIVTTESSTLTAEKASGFSPNLTFPLGISSRTVIEEYPVFPIHRRSFLHATLMLYPDLEALGLSLAKLAFELTSKVQRLMDGYISIQRGPFTRQVHAMNSIDKPSN